MTALLDAAHAKAVAGGTTKAEVLAAAAAARNIPPHHPEATSGEDAYRWVLLELSNLWNYQVCNIIRTRVTPERRVTSRRTTTGEDAYMCRH